MNEIAKNLVGYCGLYCSACGIYQGKIKQTVENLRKAISTYGVDKIALEFVNWEPAFQHYAEFEKVLEGFVKIFGSCSGCVAGGGDPSCMIRDCCKQKAYTTCVECIEMDTCEELRTTALFQRCIIKTLRSQLKLNP